MFRRKNKTLQEKFREAIWPKMGWKRVFRYYGLRIYRLNDPPYAVAAGLASGVAVSFTPFIGFHVIISLILARLLNGSMLAALIGTLFGNPWTLPLIWYITYKFGMLILGSHMPEPLPVSFEMDSIFDQPQRFLIPMVIGSIPIGVVAWAATFFPAKRLIMGLQHQRARLRARARLKEMKRRKKLLAQQKEQAREMLEPVTEHHKTPEDMQ